MYIIEWWSGYGVYAVIGPSGLVKCYYRKEDIPEKYFALSGT